MAGSFFISQTHIFKSMLPIITPTPKEWLINAIIEPLEGSERLCYYDKRHNRFVSISLAIHLTLDAELQKRVPSAYNKHDLLVYKDLIERLSRNDGTVQPINKLSLDERKQVQRRFVKMLEGMSEQQEVYDIVATQEPSTTLVLDKLANYEKHLAQIETWWLMKYRDELLEEFVTRLVTAYNIDLTTVTVWQLD